MKPRIAGLFFLTIFGASSNICASSDWDVHKYWSWTKNPSQDYAEAYTHALKTDGVVLIVVFSQDDDCNNANMHLADKVGRAISIERADLTIGNTTYSYPAESGASFEIFELSNEMLLALQKSNSMRIKTNGHAYSFSLSGSKVAIKGAHQVCSDLVVNKRSSYESEPSDESPPSESSSGYDDGRDSSFGILLAMFFIVGIFAVHFFIQQRTRSSSLSNSETFNTPNKNRNASSPIAENTGTYLMIFLLFVVPGALGYFMNGINGLFIGLFAGPLGFFFNLWQMLLN